MNPLLSLKTMLPRRVMKVSFIEEIRVFHVIVTDKTLRRKYLISSFGYSHTVTNSLIFSIFGEFPYCSYLLIFYDFVDVAKKYPPSLRIMVLETNLPKLKVGELFVVTYKGGTLGREGAHHDVIIPDINVSKVRLQQFKLSISTFIYFNSTHHL